MESLQDQFTSLLFTIISCYIRLHYKIWMITDKTLKERDLDELYDWVDSLSLSRPKKYLLIQPGI